MFSNLTNLGYERNGKQAVGFYLAYFLLAILLGGVAGGFVGLVTGRSDFNLGLRVGNIMAVLLCTIVSSAIVIKKRNRSFEAILLILASTALAIFLGALGGYSRWRT